MAEQVRKKNREMKRDFGLMSASATKGPRSVNEENASGDSAGRILKPQTKHGPTRIKTDH